MFDNLKKEIPFQWKIQSTPKEWKSDPSSQKKGTCVAYIDARDVMDLLDTVCGPENWQSEFYQVKNTMFCRLGINVGGNWIYKCDAGSPPDENSGDDAVIKGEPSDAFKRSAVQWGIGRFLYSKKVVWISKSDYDSNKYDLSEFCNRNIKKSPPIIKEKNLVAPPKTTADDLVDQMEMEDDIEHLKTIFAQLYPMSLSEKQQDFYKSKYDTAKLRISKLTPKF